MRGLTLLAFLFSLGVLYSFSRPRISKDNTFIESFFKTLKYTPGYPGRFRNMVHARELMADFIDWYNTRHRHSAIGHVTPQQRRTGEDKAFFKIRNKAIEEAKELNLERWGKRRTMTWSSPSEIILNPEKKPDAA